MKYCWFGHNYDCIEKFQLHHIQGKKLKVPSVRAIVAIMKCSKCDVIKEVFLKEVSSSIADSEVKELNELLARNNEYYNSIES